MMNTRTSTLLTVTMGLLLGTAATDSQAKSSKQKKHDPIVGAWAGTDATDVTFFLSAVFNADGTAVAQDTGGAQQAIPGRFPARAYGIVSGGVWEKIGKRRYKTVFSYVLSAKDLITRTAKSTTNPCPATTPNPCCPVDPNATYCDGDLLLQGIPVARVRNEIIAELSDDCQVLSGTGTISFYAPGDITFEGPHTPARAITATLRKIQLEFKN